MRITGCESCGLNNLCSPSEKSLGICDDYFEIHESKENDDWAEDENRWAEILYYLYLDKDVLEDEFEYELTSW